MKKVQINVGLRCFGTEICGRVSPEGGGEGDGLVLHIGNATENITGIATGSSARSVTGISTGSAIGTSTGSLTGSETGTNAGSATGTIPWSALEL